MRGKRARGRKEARKFDAFDRVCQMSRGHKQRHPCRKLACAAYPTVMGVTFSTVVAVSLDLVVATLWVSAKRRYALKRLITTSVSAMVRTPRGKLNPNRI